VSETGDAHTEGRGGELAFQEVHSIGFIDRFSKNLVAHKLVKKTEE
jgi:hypothetical protein